jgi:hypothetical protein
MVKKIGIPSLLGIPEQEEPLRRLRMIIYCIISVRKKYDERVWLFLLAEGSSVRCDVQQSAQTVLLVY